MKLKIAQFLRWLLTFVEPVVVFPATPAAIPPLDIRAAALVAEAELLKASGEYRRHQVYARLLKEFPEQKRELGIAIERAVLNVA